jgi:CheY-like chemotaxis protein
VAEVTKGAYAGATTEMIENLLGEFLDETAERCVALQTALAKGGDLGELRRFAFEVRGQASNFGQSLLEVVVQRMDNYLSAVESLGADATADLRVYLDAIDDVLNGTIEPDADPALVVRGLPARPAPFDARNIEVRDVEVMLVMLHGAQTHFIEREMRACGYRVTIVTSTIGAINQVVKTKPDMVVISAVMPNLTGIDLAIALSAMTETRNTPVALITSLPPENDQLKLLPPKVPIIRKGESFGDDLAKALEYHFLL